MCEGCCALFKGGGSLVTKALSTLSKKGLINYHRYSYLTLTAAGRVAARDVVGRHKALRQFFVRVLAIDATVAYRAACKIEPVASRAIMIRIVFFMKYLDTCPERGWEIVNQFDGRALRTRPSARGSGIFVMAVCYAAAHHADQLDGSGPNKFVPLCGLSAGRYTEKI